MKAKLLITVSLCLLTIISSAQTNVFDNFERSSGLGSNWTVYFGAGSVGIVYGSDLGFTNSSTLFGIAAWTGSTFTADQYSQAVISPDRIDSMLTQVFVRRRTSDFARYAFHWSNEYGGRLEIKYDGVPTPQVRILASLAAPEPLAGDTIRIEIQGMTIKGFHNGVLKLTATDTAFTTSSPITTTGDPGMAYRFTVGFPAFYPQQVFEEWNGGNIIATSINENTELNSLSIYPNPAQQFFIVDFPKQKFDVIIIDVIGKIVLEEKNISGKIEIDSNNILNGIYFVIATNGKNILNKKLIINK